MNFLRFKIAIIIKAIKHFLNKCFAPIILDITYYLYSHSDNNNMFRNLFIVNKKILKFKPLTPFRLINHRLYAELNPTSSINTLITNRIGYTSNLIYNSEDSDFSLIPSALPDIYEAMHKNVRVQGDSELILDIRHNYAINDFSFNMDSRFENVDGILFTQKRNMALLKYDGVKCMRFIKSGILISGKFSKSYYHQMYEIMVKLLVLNRSEIPDDVPLIVDEIVFRVKSFKQLFESLNCTGRKIVSIGEKEIVEFETLYTISSINTITPNRKYIHNVTASEIILDITLLKEMRKRLLDSKSNMQFPSKIFISRNSTKNRTYNENEVIKLVKNYGFIVIAPEDYNLFEQIALFNGADFIIGATGAAFSNILFCNTGCKIICLQSRKINIPVFTTIAYSLNIEMRYCIGTAKNSNLHSEFKIDLNLMQTMLNKIL